MRLFLFCFFQLVFYVVMFSENLLLLAAWLAGVWPNFSPLLPLLVLFSFFMGEYFMFIIIIQYSYLQLLLLQYGIFLPIVKGYRLYL